MALAAALPSHASSPNSSSAPRLRRAVGTVAGFVVAASIMCAGQPAFAAGHRQPVPSHSGSHASRSTGSRSVENRSTGSRSVENRSTGSRSVGSRSVENRSVESKAKLAKHEDSKVDLARAAACPGRGGHDGKSHLGDSQTKNSKREKAARERAAELARKAAEQKAAEQQQAAQQRVAQIGAARLLQATHALNVAHQQAVQLRDSQLRATAAAVEAVNAARTSALQVAALETPVSLVDVQQVLDLTTWTQYAPNVATSNVRTPNLPQAGQPARSKSNPARSESNPARSESNPARSESNPGSKPVTASPPIADDPILAIPTMIVTAGLSVGAAPEILLALVLLSGLGLVVFGTYRRKTSGAAG